MRKSNRKYRTSFWGTIVTDLCVGGKKKKQGICPDTKEFTIAGFQSVVKQRSSADAKSRGSCRVQNRVGR